MTIEKIWKFLRIAIYCLGFEVELLEFLQLILRGMMFELNFKNLTIVTNAIDIALEVSIVTALLKLFIQTPAAFQELDSYQFVLLIQEEKYHHFSESFLRHFVW